MEFRTVVTANGSRISFPAEYATPEAYKRHLEYNLRIAQRNYRLGHMVPLINKHLDRLDRALSSPLLTVEFCVMANIQARVAFLDAIRHQVSFSHFHPYDH